MVAHTRAAARAHRLRPLNRARPIHVEADESGEPQAVVLGRQRLAVAAVQDRWRIDDEWWRRTIVRCYFEVLVTSGSVFIIFQDLYTGGWFEQPY